MSEELTKSFIERFFNSAKEPKQLGTKHVGNGNDSKTTETL